MAKAKGNGNKPKKRVPDQFICQRCGARISLVSEHVCKKGKHK